MSEETKMVERLRSHKPYNAFTDGPLVLEAAVMIERLVRERKEAQEDESSLLLIAHLDGAARGRRSGLEEAAKIAELYNMPSRSRRYGPSRAVSQASLDIATAIRARMGEA